MRLATWNVNSVRARTDRVVDWLVRTDTDVLAIQETKCRDDQFPTERFTELGYEGQPGFAKPAADSLDIATPVVEARAIGATCGGVRVWSLYVPNGRELSDPHYAYKLDWLATLRDDAAQWLADDPNAQVALVGDWNVAPTDEDVWDPALFDGKTHTSQPERDAFAAFEEIGFAEVTRPHTPGPGVYTYWDYTQLRFPKRQGMRIDF